LYEIAAVITDNGSHRQMIHPDLPFQQECPLYVAFVALQDVTADMGPTTFLRGTQTKDYNLVVDVDDDFLKGADVVVSTLNAGDAVVFDARILHCGNANESSQSRALLNFSFKRPDSGHLGYEGSIRKGYVDKTSLGELLQVADSLNGWVGGGDGDFAGSDGTKTLESVYGDGLTR
jgi:ectoine hydroxylase-related dioxygenase (phytanoyl-CoA dioxygenase family)